MIEEINSDDDLRKALERLDEIWSVRPGDSDWEERKVLVKLISVYEDREELINFMREKVQGLRKKEELDLEHALTCLSGLWLSNPDDPDWKERQSTMDVIMACDDKEKLLDFVKSEIHNILEKEIFNDI